MGYMMDQQHSLPENSHFVGTRSHFTHVEQANNSPVDIQSDGNEDIRTEVRLIWKQEEDGRVVFS